MQGTYVGPGESGLAWGVLGARELGGNLLFGEKGRGAFVQTGTAVEDQECAADVSWSHRRCPGVEESVVSQLTWLVAERGGAVVRLGSPCDGTSAAGPEAPSGGNTASVGSPGQHAPIQQHSSEVVLGVAAAGGVVGEPSHSPGVLVALPWGSAGVGSVIPHGEVRMKDSCAWFGAFPEARHLVAALPSYEPVSLDVAA